MRNIERGNLEGDNFDAGIDLTELGKDVANEAENLEGKLNKKSLGEKIVSEVQTRHVPEDQQQMREESVDRSELNRFERGQILKAYKILRKEIREAEKDGEDVFAKKMLLKDIRGRAKKTEAQLDDLEKQFEENVSVVEVETKYGNFSVPVTELDLNRPKEGEKDERIPYVFWGGINSNVETNGCVLMALALKGQRVLGIPHFEQKQVKKPEGVTATNIFKQEQGFGVHAQVTAGVLEKLGIEKCNLIGYSTGASIALESAIKFSEDEKMSGRINDLIAIEPVGVDEAGLAGLTTGLGKNILQDMGFSEARIKVLKQAAETNDTEQKAPLDLQAVMTLTKRHFTPERLGKINVEGKFQIWSGTSSGLMNIEAIEESVQEANQLIEQNGKGSKAQIYEVKGGTHYSPIINAVGFVNEIVSEDEDFEMIRRLNKKDLANSAARQFLSDLK